MKFQKTVNIWNASQEAIDKLQPGQWVSAGAVEPDKSNMGRFLGVKASGSVVVAWLGNERNQGSYLKRIGYIRTLRLYAKS